MIEAENVMADAVARIDSNYGKDAINSGVNKKPPLTILAIDTPKLDGVVYSGRVVADVGEVDVDLRVLEQALLPVKHCFQGEHEDVPLWMLDTYRENSGKHSRMSIAYVASRSGSQLTIDFYRSMAKGACGAHQLHKITPQNEGNQRYARVWYNGKRYFAVPMVTCEANRLMGLFGTMTVDVLNRFFAEQEPSVHVLCY